MADGLDSAYEARRICDTALIEGNRFDRDTLEAEITAILSALSPTGDEREVASATLIAKNFAYHLGFLKTRPELLAQVDDVIDYYARDIAKALAQARLAEAERCAKIAEWPKFTCGMCGLDGQIAAAIRASKP